MVEHRRSRENSLSAINTVAFVLIWRGCVFDRYQSLRKYQHRPPRELENREPAKSYRNVEPHVFVVKLSSSSHCLQECVLIRINGAEGPGKESELTERSSHKYWDAVMSGDLKCPTPSLETTVSMHFAVDGKVRKTPRHVHYFIRVPQTLSNQSKLHLQRGA